MRYGAPLCLPARPGRAERWTTMRAVESDHLHPHLLDCSAQHSELRSSEAAGHPPRLLSGCAGTSVPKELDLLLTPSLVEWRSFLARRAGRPARSTRPRLDVSSGP